MISPTDQTDFHYKQSNPADQPHMINQTEQIQQIQLDRLWW